MPFGSLIQNDTQLTEMAAHSNVENIKQEIDP